MTNPIRTNARGATSLREAFHDFPLVDADACVKCGLCLPHCPTYAVSRHEGDSPRGRIALLQGLAQQALEPAGPTAAHLDGCLVCRACERVCPAEVQYGRLIDAGRKGMWRAGHRPGPLWRLLAFWRRTPRRLRWLSLLLRGLRVSGLAAASRRLPLGRIARVSAFIRKTGRPPAPGTHLPPGTPRGRVGLFLGCIARPLDAHVAHAALRVLTAMGYAVIIPKAQGCCGAMDAHAGDADTAAALARRNLAAFGADLDAILATASGCGVELQDYARHGQQPDLDEARRFSARVHDIMHFVHANRQALPPLKPQAGSVLVHTPCTLRNGMREPGALEVLRGIPELNVTAFGYAHCCGAAGSYLFEHEQSADTLGNRMVDALPAQAPDVFATSNIGCALHIGRLLDQRGLPTRVRHPIELLAASLPDA